MRQLLFCIALLINSTLLAQNLTEPSEHRIQMWMEDLEFLQQKIKEEHYRFDHSIGEREFDSLVQNIRANIAGMNDLQVIGSFMKLLASIQDGHTLLYPPFEGKYAFKALPVDLYFFGEDLFIRAASPEYSHLVGSRVVKAGKMDLDILMAKMKTYFGRDNDQQLRWIAPVALSFSDLYVITDASSQRDKITFTLETQDGDVTEHVVKAGPLVRDPLGRFAPSHWYDLKEDSNLLWTKDPENNYWYEYFPEYKLVYFQFNQILNKQEESIKEFTAKMFQFIDQNEVDALILDIRLNNGGNSFLNRNIIHEIIKCEKINKKGKLFTITGRRTFSAAMNFASDMERHTQTLFVGEPTGSSPNFYGEDNVFVLPYSGLTGSISSRYWQGGETSDDNRPWISPDLPAELKLEEYINNVDPAMEAILDYLKNRN